jgi:hypothetical protein
MQVVQSDMSYANGRAPSLRYPATVRRGRASSIGSLASCRRPSKRLQKSPPGGGWGRLHRFAEAIGERARLVGDHSAIDGPVRLTYERRRLHQPRTTRVGQLSTFDRQAFAPRGVCR